MNRTKENILREFERILKQVCIEAQNNEFITPIVFRQSRKVEDLLDMYKHTILEEVEEKVIGKRERTGLPVTQAQEQNSYNKLQRNTLRAEQRKKLDEMREY